MGDAALVALLLPVVLLAAFLIWAALSPFETLGWWAGWFGDKIYHDNIPPDGNVRAVRADTDSYVIFLSGIGRVSGHTFSFREQEFLRRLALAAPTTVVIDDIFPYSVNNLALTGQPFFSGLWEWALARKRYGPKLLGYLINIRNLFQVGIAVDRRYAPMYNQAVAEVLMDTLLRYQYDPENVQPVFVIGYSGAAQLAVGSATYLSEWIKGPLVIISLGGIFDSSPGLLAASHVYHLLGTHDSAQIWRFLFPGRWAIFGKSAWNRACRQGRVTVVPIDHAGHTGRGGYIDLRPRVEGEPALVDITVGLIADIVKQTQRLPASTPAPTLSADWAQQPTVASSTVASSTVASSTVASSTVASSTVAPETVKPVT